MGFSLDLFYLLILLLVELVDFYLFLLNFVVLVLVDLIARLLGIIPFFLLMSYLQQNKTIFCI